MVCFFLKKITKVKASFLSLSVLVIPIDSIDTKGAEDILGITASADI